MNISKTNNNSKKQILLKNHSVSLAQLFSWKKYHSASLMNKDDHCTYEHSNSIKPQHILMCFCLLAFALSYIMDVKLEFPPPAFFLLVPIAECLTSHRHNHPETAPLPPLSGLKPVCFVLKPNWQVMSVFKWQKSLQLHISVRETDLNVCWLNYSKWHKNVFPGDQVLLIVAVDLKHLLTAALLPHRLWTYSFSHKSSSNKV